MRDREGDDQQVLQDHRVLHGAEEAGLGEHSKARALELDGHFQRDVVLPEPRFHCLGR